MSTEKRSPKGALYLLDVSGFVFRAYHALPPLRTRLGVPTGAVLGFANMLAKLLEDHSPTHIAAVFDSGRASFRRDLYPEYKATRPELPEDLREQFPLVQRISAGFRVSSISAAGYEADDVIAALTKRARAEGLDVTIVSSDKDLMQLVGPGVRLLDTMKDQVIDGAAVRDRFGVSPEQLGDWLALVGDSSDNIPGLRGVGPKTATKLLNKYESLASMIADPEIIEETKVRQRLGESVDSLRLGRKLVTLVDDCPLDIELKELACRGPDQERLRSLFAELEFTRLLSRLTPSQRREIVAECVTTSADLRRHCDDLEGTEWLALALETEPSTRGEQLVGIGVSSTEDRAFYIPLAHRYIGVPQQLGWSEVCPLLAAALRRTGAKVVLHDHKRYQSVLTSNGIALEVAGDPMLMSYVLDPSQSSHELGDLGSRYLGFESPAKRSGKPQPPSAVDIGDAACRCGAVAATTLAVTRCLLPRVAEEQRLQRLLQDMEMPLAAVLAQLEARGCLLDSDQLAVVHREVSLSCEELLEEIQQAARWPVNPNSPKQLRRLLFEQLGLSAGRKTKTGFSTDSEVLADLALQHPVAAKIDEWRGLSKLKNTYLEALPKLVSPRTGRLHTRYNQAVAATGRLSSSDPNLQNIPIRTELGRRIREAFVAPEGQVLLSADYSQIELRVLAHLSQDQRLLDSFARGEDVHQRTAAEVFGVELEDVDAEQRRVAKAVNFGVIYGQTDWGLARQLRIGRRQAAEYIAQYFTRYSGVDVFMQQSIEQARQRGFVETLFGRRRAVPDIRAPRRASRLYAERIARNTPIQGSAADLIKMAMIAVDRELSASGLGAQMILTVHDELVLEVEGSELASVSTVVRDAMSGVAELAVPLKVDLGSGPNWASAH